MTNEQVVGSFLDSFFDQNPISQVSLVELRGGKAEKITELSGNSRHHKHKLEERLAAHRSVGAGMPSMRAGLEVALQLLEMQASYGTREPHAHSDSTPSLTSSSLLLSTELVFVSFFQGWNGRRAIRRQGCEQEDRRKLQVLSSCALPYQCIILLQRRHPCCAGQGHGSQAYVAVARRGGGGRQGETSRGHVGRVSKEELRSARRLAVSSLHGCGKGGEAAKRNSEEGGCLTLNGMSADPRGLRSVRVEAAVLVAPCSKLPPLVSCAIVPGGGGWRGKQCKLSSCGGIR
eukprot:763428-Hanusia_phi.AAC.1